MCITLRMKHNVFSHMDNYLTPNIPAGRRNKTHLTIVSDSWCAVCVVYSLGFLWVSSDLHFLHNAWN